MNRQLILFVLIVAVLSIASCGSQDGTVSFDSAQTSASPQVPQPKVVIFVIDGAAVSANPGVNPSLTISALAERAMSFIPPKPAPPAPETSNE